jgi:hypothetical protein
MNKSVGYALIVIGVTLLVAGVLDVSGFLSLQIVDTSEPSIIYTYPKSGSIYKVGEIDEYVVYARDKDSLVTQASYTDKYNPAVQLKVTPYVQLKHPMTIIYMGKICKFPDLNFDGKVDNTDNAILQSSFGSKEGNPDYNPAYDIVPDGSIDIYDSLVMSIYIGTVTFSATPTVSYVSENVTFAFAVLNNFGLICVYTGSFQVGDYMLLRGKWFVNNIEVNSTSQINIESNKITIQFNCSDTTIPENTITVKVKIGDAIFYLDRFSSYSWKKELELAHNVNDLVLEASTQTYLNRISVTVVTPKKENVFSIGHSLIVIGLLFVCMGIIVISKKEEVTYY